MGRQPRGVNIHETSNHAATVDDAITGNLRFKKSKTNQNARQGFILYVYIQSLRQKVHRDLYLEDHREGSWM